MFKWFKKKNSKTKINEELTYMDAEDVLQAIYVIKKRSNIDKHQATFFNAHIPKKEQKKLERKCIRVEFFSSDNSHGFKVFW